MTASQCFTEDDMRNMNDMEMGKGELESGEYCWNENEETGDPRENPQKSRPCPP